MKKAAIWVAAVLVGFVVAVNVLWFVVPLFGSPYLYRPIFFVLFVVLVVGSVKKIRAGG